MPAPLRAVHTSCWGMEYSVHCCPPKLRKEVQSVFPKVDTAQLLMVPTCQKAAMDLVQFGEKADNEKDYLLERFLQWAVSVTDILLAKGYWSDYIDPCSGLSMVHQDSQAVYPEVEGLVALLGYKTATAGCCKIVLHPKWGSAVYPATLFTMAPPDVLEDAIRQTERSLNAGG